MAKAKKASSRKKRRRRQTPFVTHIALENFKGFIKTGFLPLRPLTFLVGANSSGKSSLLKAIAAYSQTVSKGQGTERTLNTNGDMVDIGIFDEIANNPNKNFSLSFIIQPDAQPGVTKTKDNPEWLNYEFGPAKNKTDSILKAIRIGDVDDPFQIVKQTDTINPQIMEYPNFEIKRTKTAKTWKITQVKEMIHTKTPEADIFFKRIMNAIHDMLPLDPNDQAARRIGRELLVSDLEVDVHDCIGVDPRHLRSIKKTSKKRMLEEYRNSYHIAQRIKKQALRDKRMAEYKWKLDNAAHHLYNDKVDPLTAGACRALARSLRQTRYIGPLREEPTRKLKISSTSSYDDEVGKWGENTAQLLHQIDSDTKLLLQKSINKMKLGLDVGTIEFDSDLQLGPSGFIQIYLKEYSGAKRVLADVGFGVSQVLPIVVECCITRNSTILLEQPELHLHPGLQTELGDLLIDSVWRGNQIIVETHSVNMLERIRRRIREGEIKHDMVNILYFRKDSKGSVPFSIGLDPDGDFTKPWPDDDGFFGEREKELFSDYF